MCVQNYYYYSLDIPLKSITIKPKNSLKKIFWGQRQYFMTKEIRLPNHDLDFKSKHNGLNWKFFVKNFFEVKIVFESNTRTKTIEK